MSKQSTNNPTTTTGSKYSGPSLKRGDGIYPTNSLSSTNVPLIALSAPMYIKRARRLLVDHHIEVVYQGNRLYALELAYHTIEKRNQDTWIDVTDWTRKELLFWLGY